MTEETSYRRAAMRSILILSALAAAIILVLLTTTVARAQSLSVVYNFCLQPYCPDGQLPGPLIQGTDGNFYGTTQDGGTDGGGGTIFKITPGGTLTTLHTFCARPKCPDGENPASLMQAANGDFYGVATDGGANGGGTLFKISPGGEFTTLHSFCNTEEACSDGTEPFGALVQATDGDIYGTTSLGGAHNGGTVFKLTPSGVLTTLYNFCSRPNCADGAFPDAALIQATDGDFYGTNYNGGSAAQWAGTVFRMTPDGELTTVYNFCSEDYPYCSDGYKPEALIQAVDGDFYGTTTEGGPNISGRGTVFKLTPRGALTTLHNFCSQPNCTDGSIPDALIQASNGDLYGTTAEGGSAALGTIFSFAPGQALKTLFNFCSGQPCADGDSFIPNMLFQATNGNFYGTTSYGGGSCDSNGECFNGGSIFSLSVGLGPFVALQTTSGVIGAQVSILGTDLTSATGVFFNGAPATFEVNSTGTAIRATVPAGATSGTVTVTTPGGALSSNKPFTVRE
jgi:uncharacterized repeat protein (TIGR03803 family)